VKRFHWPLQRLLDVTEQREKAQRAELLGLSRRIAQLRQESLVHRASVRRLIAELSALTLRERLLKHPDFMRCSDAHERQVQRLEEHLAQLARQRTDKTHLLLRTRKRRETLERLREEARQKHIREELKIEQKQFDESAHISKARQMIAARAAGAERV
jgi:flagellar biosynthesis chaperone FliJ